MLRPTTDVRPPSAGDVRAWLRANVLHPVRERRLRLAKRLLALRDDEALSQRLAYYGT
jgi:hypothetical protein